MPTLHVRPLAGGEKQVYRMFRKNLESRIGLMCLMHLIACSRQYMDRDVSELLLVIHTRIVFTGC